MTTFRIIVATNISNLAEKRPFDVLAAERGGFIELTDPDDEDEPTKDVQTQWPLGPEASKHLSYTTWWRVYAMPILESRGTMSVIIDSEDGATLGFSQHYYGMDPHAWAKIDKDRLGAEAGEKLAKIREIVDAP